MQFSSYINTHDGRRSLAFLAIVGGSMVFTCLIIATVWMLREYAGFLFWLALAAHAQVFVGMSAIGWAMGRRAVISVTKDGATVDDMPRIEE